MYFVFSKYSIVVFHNKNTETEKIDDLIKITLPNLLIQSEFAFNSWFKEYSLLLSQIRWLSLSQ